MMVERLRNRTFLRKVFWTAAVFSTLKSKECQWNVPLGSGCDFLQLATFIIMSVHEGTGSSLKIGKFRVLFNNPASL